MLQALRARKGKKKGVRSRVKGEKGETKTAGGGMRFCDVGCEMRLCVDGEVSGRGEEGRERSCDERKVTKAERLLVLAVEVELVVGLVQRL